MRKLIFIIIALVLLLSSCVALTKIITRPVATMELTELMYRGKPSGIRVPAIYGDFSVTHSFAGAFRGEGKYMIIYMNMRLPYYSFTLYAKDGCPEAIALAAYNQVTKETDRWVYEGKQPWKTNMEGFKEEISKGHPCPVKGVLTS